MSIENAIILENTQKWPLCIDPQNIADSFIKNRGAELKDLFKVIKNNDDRLNIELENAIKFGKWLLIENVNETLSTELEPILNPQIKFKGKNKLIK